MNYKLINYPKSYTKSINIMLHCYSLSNSMLLCAFIMMSLSNDKNVLFSCLIFITAVTKCNACIGLLLCDLSLLCVLLFMAANAPLGLQLVKSKERKAEGGRKNKLYRE